MTNTYNYPNAQEATTLWFHDHTLGIVRLNVYAGLEGFYFIRDSRDTGLATNPITLPSGNQEAELLLADRQFDTNGQLYFPASDNPANLNGPPGNPDKHPFWIPEFFGDVITVNGKSWPSMEVQPRRYRFRFVNGSNARFFIMQMFNQQGVDMHQNGAPGPAIWQIGSDGGLFNNPVKLDDPANGANACAGSPIGNNVDVRAGAKCLFLAPAERADVIVDFGGQAGKTFTLKNFAVIPFPSGSPTGFGAPDATADGLVMQFKVDLPLQGTDTTFNPAGSHPALRAAPIVNIKTIAPNKKRQLILVEEEGDTANPDGPGSPVDDGDPVESLINNTKWNGNREGTTIVVPGSISNGHGVSATETPQEGSTELWEVANLTGDAHPIHIHLIQFQVISRQTVRRRQLPHRLDGGLSGRHVQRVQLPTRHLHPRLRPAAHVQRPQQRRRAGRQPELRRRQVPAAGGLRGRRLSAARARAAGQWLEGHHQDVPRRDHPDRRALGAAGHRGERDHRRSRTTSRSIRPRARLHRALPHPRPRGQRVHAAHVDRQVIVALRVLLLAVAAVALAAALAIGLRGRGGDHAAFRYACPMHPEVRADAPGECSICRMALERVGKPAPLRTGPPPPRARTSRRWRSPPAQHRRLRPLALAAGPLPRAARPRFGRPGRHGLGAVL